MVTPLTADDHVIFELVARPTRTIDLMSTTVQTSSSDSNTLPIPAPPKAVRR